MVGAGAGDYCEAFAVDGTWIFLFARTHEASASLERVAALMPQLAARLPLRVPVPEHVGRAGEAGRAFVGYRRLEGRPLGAAPPPGPWLDGLALFIRSLHGTDVQAAVDAGVPLCDYAFAATEDELRAGTAEHEYGRDLERLSTLPSAVAVDLERSLERHLAAPCATPALLHGELSGEHVLLDPAGRISGIIDFNGMIVGDPARDLLYLYEEQGEPGILSLLERGALAEPSRDVLQRLRFLRLWHAALRWLWLVDHGYDGSARLAELRSLTA